MEAVGTERLWLQVDLGRRGGDRVAGVWVTEDSVGGALSRTRLTLRGYPGTRSQHGCCGLRPRVWAGPDVPAGSLRPQGTAGGVLENEPERHVPPPPRMSSPGGALGPLTLKPENSLQASPGGLRGRAVLGGRRGRLHLSQVWFFTRLIY